MPIANFFIVRILDYIRRETEHDEDDMDMMRYSLQAILWELEKTVYLAILFVSLGLGWHFLMVMVVLLTVRPDAGGFHSSTVWGCFCWTLLGFSLAIVVLPWLLPINSLFILLVGGFSLAITYIAAPLRSKQMERIAKKDKDKQKKITVTLVTFIWFLVLFRLQEHFLAPTVLWAIFLQNFQLWIEWLKRQRELV